MTTIFPIRFRDRLKTLLSFRDLEEIRVRIGQAMEFLYAGKSRFLTWEGDDWRISGEDIGEMLNYISRYSLYAYREKIRQGFVTIEGGHRIGLAGSVVTEHGEITGISPVTYLNIRTAHQRIDCAKDLLGYICTDGGIYHTLLVSKPGVGKTTYLRDLIRLLSMRNLKVGVVDERSEICACHRGIPQNDIGPRTDVLDGCSKAEGMMMLLRVMSPQVIAVDELGKREDFLAVEEAAVCGCKILATVHAGNPKELERKPYLKNWVTQGLFERYVFLYREEAMGRQYQVYNGSMERLC